MDGSVPAGGAGRCRDRGVRLRDPGGAPAGNGGANAGAGVDQSRVPVGRGLGGRLSCAGIAASASAAGEALLLSRFRRRHGGLLREPDLLARRDAFRADSAGRGDWLARRGVLAGHDETCVSLFAYEQARLPGLIHLWTQGAQRLHVLVPEGRVLCDVERALGRTALKVGDCIHEGSLSVHVLPFTDQDGYDELLWACDLNFVRGEDSFVRAQWAGVPCVWQIYPQDEDAHFDKLEAFMARYLAGAALPEAEAFGAFWRAWNGRGDPAAAWPAFAAALPGLQRRAARWCDDLARQSDLVSRLTGFCSHIPAVAG